MEQPIGCWDLHFPKHAYELKKALHRVIHAPRAWYDRLTTFIVNNGHKQGIYDKTSFIKHIKNDIMYSKFYVDDIVFGFMSCAHTQEFISLMQHEFEMRIVGELSIFLGI